MNSSSNGSSGSTRPTRTPQPPPSVSTNSSTASNARSRSTTPSATAASSPSSASGPPARSTKATKAASNNDASPRASVRRPTATTTAAPTAAIEPATDEEEDRGDEVLPSATESWMRESEAVLVSMSKQIQDAARRNQKHQSRCSTMQEYMAGKQQHMDSLRGSYATLTRELADLEQLSNSECDLDPATLDELFLSIPPEQRRLEEA